MFTGFYVKIKAKGNKNKKMERGNINIDPKQVLDFAGVIIVALDKKANVTAINEYGAKILGYKSKDVIGKNWLKNFISKQDRSNVEKAFKLVVAGKKNPVEYFDNFVITKSGKEIMMAWHNTVLKDKEGNVIGTLSSGIDITERKKVEEKIEDSEERYRQIIDNVNDVIYELKPNGIISFITPNVEYWGYKVNEVVGKKLLDFVHPDYKKRIAREFNDTVKKGKIFPSRFKLNKGGNDFWVEEYGKPVFKNGKIVSINGVLRDVTNTVKIEELLRQNEDRYKSIFNTSPEAIVILDIKGYILDANDRIFDWLGYKKEELLGKHFLKLSFLTKEGKLTIAKKFVERLAKKDVSSYDVTFLDRYGCARIGRVSGAIIENKKKEKMVLVMISDVTESRKAEEKYRTVSENTPDCMKIVDLKGSISYLNRASFKNHDINEANEVLGKSFINIMDPSNKKENLTAFNKAKKGEVVTKNFVINKKGKKPKYILRTFSPIKDLKGKVIEVHIICRDITDIKEVEKQVIESRKIFKDLYETSVNLRGTTDEILSTITNKVHEIFGGLFVLINYAKEGEFHFKAGCNLPKVFKDMKKESIKGSICSHVIETKKPLFINNLKQAKCPRCKMPFSKDGAVKSFGLNTYIGVPLIFSDGSVRGTLCILYKEKLENVDEQNLKILSILGDKVALELEKEEERKAIEESEKKYRSVIENGTEMILVIQDGSIRMANPRGFQITGFSEEELRSKPFISFIYPEDRDLVMKNHIRRLKGEKFPPYDFRILKKGGGYAWMQITAVVLEWEGKPAVLTFLNDITKRKGAEERFKCAAQVTSDFIYEWDIKTNILEWFGDFDKALGYKKNEISRTMDAWLKIVHPDDRSRLSNSVKKHLKDLSPINEEYRVVKKDGKILYWSDNGHPVVGEKGKVAKWIGGCKDITEKKLARKEIEEVQKRMEDLVKNLNVGIYRNTPGKDGMFLHANPAMLKMFETKDLKQLQRKKVSQYYQNSKDRAEFNNKLISKGHIENEELKLKTYTGKNFWGAVTAVVKTNEDGTKYFDGVFQNITEKKKIQDEISKTKDRLSALLNHLTVGIYRNTPGKDGCFIEANPAIIKMFEAKTKEDFMKHNFSDLYVDSNKRKEFNEKIMKYGYLKNEELKLKTLKSREFWASITAVMKKDENGKIYFDGWIEDISDRKKSDEILEKSQAEYNQLIEASLDGFVTSTIDGKFLDCNSAYEKMVGYSINELRKLKYTQLTPKKWQKWEADIVKNKILKTGRSGLYHKEYIRKDGSIFSVELNTYLIRDKQGKPVKMMAFARDITERVEAENAIKDAEAKYRDIVENSPEMIHSIDANGYIVFSNTKEYELLGYNPGELVGIHMSKLYSPVLLKDIKKGFRQLKEEGSLYIPSSQMIKKNGDSIDVEIHSIAIYDEGGKYNGKFVRTRSIARDITQEKKAQVELSKMQLGFERSDQIMFMTDIDGKINYINPSFEKIYGYKKDEVIGKTPRVIKSGEHEKSFYSNFWNTLLNKKPINTELVNKTKNGALIDIKASVNPIIGDNDEIIGFLAIQSDITKQKKAEIKLNEKLEQMEFVGRANLKRHKKMLTMEKEIERLKKKISLFKNK